MLRTYLYKNVFVHACHQLLGLVIAIAFIYVHYTGLIGLKPQYDISHSVNDAISFLAIFLVMLLVGFQFLKGYLLYFPSIYLSFGTNGLSFKKFKNEFRFIKWDDIKIIALKVENEWMLNLFIEKYDGEVIRLVLSELWLLSFTRKLCVNHNFLKFLAIANKYPILMTKLDKKQIEEFYRYCDI